MPVPTSLNVGESLSTPRCPGSFEALALLPDEYQMAFQHKFIFKVKLLSPDITKPHPRLVFEADNKRTFGATISLRQVSSGRKMEPNETAVIVIHSQVHESYAIMVQRRRQLLVT